ncbi:MAG TPA: vWA domain-containing protein, partial [Bacteroidota bacterium]
MPEVSFSSAFSIFLLLLGGLAAFGLARLSYATTTPPVSPRLRRTLLLLRGSGLALLFLFIGEPLLSLIQTHARPPVIAVLIDDSRSMTIADPSGTRSGQVLDILQSESINKLAGIGVVRPIAFGAQPRILGTAGPESLKFENNQTDIAAALRFVQQQSLSDNIRSVVLLSDGNNTLGPSPLFDEQALSIPVFAVGLGDTSDQKDVLIRKITTNSLVYTGTRVPVRVQIRSSGARNERVEVRLRQNSAIVDRQFLLLEPGVREYTVDLFYTPSEKGVQRYSLDVSEIPGELTGRNNRDGFFVKVLESKMRILLLAGSPGPDVAFLRRVFESDSAITVNVHVERGGGAYYGATPGAESFLGQDCIALVGVPSPATPRSVIDFVLQAAKRGAGVFFVPSRTMDFTRLELLAPILPMHINNPTHDEQAVFLHPPDGAANDVLLRLPSEFPPDSWSRLPPLYTVQGDIRAKPEARVHAFTRIRTAVTDEPMLLSRNVNGKKSIVFLGYGLWRWTMLADPSIAGMLDAWMNTCMRWLSTREDDRRIRISSVKEVFTVGEQVEFSGQVYNETLHPVEGAQVSVTVKSGRQIAGFTMKDLGNGQYDGHLQGLEEGDYTYEATVQKDGSLIG